MMPPTRWASLVAVLALLMAGTIAVGQETSPVVAIVGATVIDGNGGVPLQDATVLIRGPRIAAVGPRSSVDLPSGARIIDGAGKYVIPGLVDTNVHMSPLNDEETFARYWDRLDELILQGLQLQLRHGVTTVRDSYGTLVPLQRVRDRIARAEAIGPRTYVAGNIVGWGGYYSKSMGVFRERDLTYFQEQINDLFTWGTDEELAHMTLAELRVAINAYLDRDPDFIKYGGTTEGFPALMVFSQDAQRVIVQETHRRGLVVETHATTPEALRNAVLAGIDVIQHPEALGLREIPDELVQLIVERGIVCSMLPNKYTGRMRQRFLAQREQATAAAAERAADRARGKPLTAAELRRKVAETGRSQPGTILGPDLEMRWRNGQKLIRAGCTISVGADNLLFGRPGVAPEFLREDHPVPEHLEPGTGTILAIEGLVALGMTPSQAIVAATRNGALASKALDEYGTVEVGKYADLLLLDADPLVVVSNIRKLVLLLKEGQVIDPESLPVHNVTAQW